MEPPPTQCVCVLGRSVEVSWRIPTTPAAALSESMRNVTGSQFCRFVCDAHHKPARHFGHCPNFAFSALMRRTAKGEASPPIEAICRTSVAVIGLTRAQP
jgi:hypothetical protein